MEGARLTGWWAATIRQKVWRRELPYSAVSRMIAARVPIPMIAKIVGWSPSAMAKMAARYGHFGIEERRSAVESISTTAQPQFAAGYPQNPPQSQGESKANINQVINFSGGQ
jgi:hypothetical protein